MTIMQMIVVIQVLVIMRMMTILKVATYVDDYDNVDAVIMQRIGIMNML